MHRHSCNHGPQHALPVPQFAFGHGRICAFAAARLESLALLLCHAPRRFFGQFGFGFGGEQQEEQTPKGNNVVVDLEVSLKDLYLGNQFKVRRL